MNKPMLSCLSKLSIILLCILGLIEFAFALWSVLDHRYKTLAYTLADIGYIDLWILRYLSLCLFVSSIITLVMCLIFIWGLYSAHIFIFIAASMIVFVIIGEFTVSIIGLTSKYETRIILIEQLPKLVITYRQGNDERAKRALDKLQFTFQCCGADGRLSYQNNVPLSCNMYSVGCLTRTLFFLDIWMDILSYMLLLFCLFKLLIILFFYSYLCLYKRKRWKTNRRFANDSSVWRYSSSLESSSSDNVAKNAFTLSTQTTGNLDSRHEDDYVERQHFISNEYESAPNEKLEHASRNSPAVAKRNKLVSPYEQCLARKLSSISERTEKSESDDNQSESLYVKAITPRTKTQQTVYQNISFLSKRVPIIKARRKLLPDDHDSGVERSSSEKSFDNNNIQNGYSDSTSTAIETTAKSIVPTNKSSMLGFSKVFVTSAFDGRLNNAETEVSIRTDPSPSSENASSNDTSAPKSILKKSSPNLSSYRWPIDHYNSSDLFSIRVTNKYPQSKKAPKITPRSSLKQSQQDETLV